MDYKRTIYLNKEDVIFAQNAYFKLKEENFINLKEDFEKEISFLKISIDLFLKDKVNEISIAKSDLDKSLISIIHDFIDDFADCRVLTSAMQIQKNKDIFFFVTADKHFDPNGYIFLKGDSRLKGIKFPSLKNLLFEK
jgi:hypothetical protein